MLKVDGQDAPCVFCGAESIPNQCPKDGKWHQDGRVHLPDGTVVPVCKFCMSIVEQRWSVVRGGEGFWEKVDRSGDCWIWTGAKTKGYGAVVFDGKHRRAARVAWELANFAPVPDGMCVLHTCDTPACVKPSHLFLGTQADNMADMASKGRGRNGGLCGEENGHSRLTKSEVLDMRMAYSNGASRASLARQFGVSWTTIDNVVAERTWRNV